MEPVKRPSPYLRLKLVAKEFVNKVVSRRKIFGFSYTVDTDTRVAATYIKSAVEAADILGWDTLVTVVGDKLIFTYAAKLPTIAPWELR